MKLPSILDLPPYTMSDFLTTKPLLIAAGLFLAATGSSALYLESNAYLAGGPSSVLRVASWVKADVVPGLSTQTIKLTLLDCVNALAAPNSLEMLYQDEAVRTAMPATCRNMADAVTSNEPTFAYAWHVGALASAAMQDWTALDDHLLKSRLAGPTQAWVAIQRVLLAENHYDRLDAASRSANEGDIAFLVSTGYGLDQLAELYFANDDFRQRATAIVEKAPETYQRRFIAAVRAASRMTAAQ